MSFVYRSSIWATLGATLNAGDMTITLTSGHGARFSSWLLANKETWVTVIKTSDPLKPLERIKVQGPVSGNVLTVLARAQDNTTALSFNAGERVEVRWCAPMIDQCVTSEDVQTLTDVRAITVTGTANAITTTHAKPLSDIVGSGGTPTDGLLSIFEPTAENTSANPTYTPDGLATKPIKLPNGRGLASADLMPNQKAILIFDASADAWLLQNPAQRGFAVSNSVLNAGFTLDRSHYGRVMRVSGTFTINMVTAAASGLGADFWCVIDNVGTGAITLDPYGGETLLLPDGGVNSTLVQCTGSLMLVSDGTQIRVWPIGDKTGSMTVYTTPGTYTWKAGAMLKGIIVMCLGGGGGGGKTEGAGVPKYAGGGAAGAYKLQYFGGGWGSTITVTVGAGGTGGVPGSSAATPGGASSFGPMLTAAGGTQGNDGVDGVGTGGASVGSGSVAGDPGVTSTKSGDGRENTFAGWLGSDRITGRAFGNYGQGNQNLTPGGGGSGAHSPAGSNNSGGLGGPGMVIVWEF